MNIIIEGDDAQFNKGTAKNLIAIVDGTRMILPVKTKLADVYNLLEKYPRSPAPTVHPTVDAPIPTHPAVEIVDREPSCEAVSTDIERNDLVKCNSVLPRMKDASGNELVDPGIQPGGIYRVLKINQTLVTLPGSDEMTKIVRSYEVIDDKAAQPLRLFVSPEEVILYQKAPKKAKKTEDVLSEIFNCPECQQPTALLLNKVENVYMGECAHCKAPMVCDRPKKVVKV